MVVKLENLIKEIRKKKLKFVFIKTLEEYDFLWGAVSAEMKKTAYVLPLVSRTLEEGGIEHFILKGIPIILEESYNGKPL